MPSTIEVARIFSKLPFGATLKKKSGGALSFDGNELFSYHACIARKVSDKVAEVTTRKYSVTTSKHTSQVLSALIADGWTINRSEF